MHPSCRRLGVHALVLRERQICLLPLGVIIQAVRPCRSRRQDVTVIYRRQLFIRIYAREKTWRDLRYRRP